MTIKGMASKLTDVLALLENPSDRALLVVDGAYAGEWTRYTADSGQGTVDIPNWIDLRVAGPEAFADSEIEVVSGAVDFISGNGWRVSNARINFPCLAMEDEDEPVDLQLSLSIGGDTPQGTDLCALGLYRPDGLSDTSYGWSVLRRSNTNSAWQQCAASRLTSLSSGITVISTYAADPARVNIHGQQIRYSTSGSGFALGLRGVASADDAGKPNASSRFVGSFGNEPVGVRAPAIVAETNAGSGIHFDLEVILFHGRTRLEGLI